MTASMTSSTLADSQVDTKASAEVNQTNQDKP